MKDRKEFISELLQNAHALEAIDFYGQKQRIVGYSIEDKLTNVSYEFNLENGSKIVIAK